MAQREQRGTGNMDNHETLGSNHHDRTIGCTYESARWLKDTLDELLNARTAGPRVEG